MVEKKIDSVKIKIRSVLISSKGGLSLEDFCKTYKSLLGTRLPTREFGFTSDIDFLQSLPDVVHVKVEKNGCYHLYGIADQSTEHIQKLVSKQKSSKVSPRKNVRDYSNVIKTNQKFEPIGAQKCRPFIPALLRSEIIEIVKQYPDGLGYLSLIRAYQTFYKKEINLEFLSHDMRERFQKLANAVPELDLKLTHDQLKIYYRNFHNQEENTDTSASSYSPQLSKVKVSPKFKSIEIEQKQKISEATSIPKDVKSNFIKVLQQYPKGILAVHFPILYEKSTKLPLDLHEMGFTSLIELADALPDIFSRKNVPGSSKDWILLHVDFCTQASSGFKSKTPIDSPPTKFSLSCSLKGALLSDIAQPNLPYVQGELLEGVTKEFIPVFVSSVINPSLFWIQLQTEEAKSSLAKLEKDMRYFYNDQGNYYKMADVDVLIGSSCVAFSTSDFHWYRALITSLPSIDYATVSFVDYGSTEKIRRTNLYYLTYKFIDFPTHAHKSALASIKPVNQVSKWSTNAQKRFVELCNQLSLWAKVDSVNDDLLSLLLCDTTGGENIYINDVLVNEEYAEFCKLSSLSPSYSPHPRRLHLEASVCDSQKQTFQVEKSDNSKGESSNGTHFYNKSEKHNFQLRSSFVKEEATKLSSKKRRYVKKLLLGDGYKINIIIVADEAYVSGGDLCNLFWTNKEADLLALRLQFKGAVIPTVSICQNDFEELFFQCKRYSVKDFYDTGKEVSVVLYPLKYVMKILNIFGHPSLSVRETICKEIKDFNSHDVFWNEFQEPEEDEDMPYTKNTLNRLCLYDLKAMLEGLRFKRLKLVKDSQTNGTRNVTEINKIESMQNNIKKHMDVINSICSQYTS